MKLAIVRQSYTPYGGAERFVAQALAELTKQGLESSLIARQWSDPNPASDNNLLQHYQLCNPFYIGRTWRDYSFAKAVQEIIKRGEYDLVQSHERIAGCNIYRAGDGVHATWLQIRQKISAKFALTDRLSLWHRYTLQAENALYQDKNLQLVICNSLMVSNDLASRFPQLSSKLQLVRNGVQLNRFTPDFRQTYRQKVRSKFQIGENEAVILFVGSGFLRKGLFTLLSAQRHMQQAAHILIVGKDHQSAEVAEYLKKHNLLPQVHLLGAQKEVMQFYAAADIFCLPSYYDPLPNACLEALASGLPVITSRGSGSAELLREFAEGSVINAGDITTLANYLDQYVEQLPSKRADFIDAARSCACQYSEDKMVGKLIELYQQLIKS